MQIDVEVKNLGRLKSGVLKVRPITVVTGPNGTGKSFFTKTMYSLLNVLNKNIYHSALELSLKKLSVNLERYMPNLSYPSFKDMVVINHALNKINSLRTEFSEASSWNIYDYMDLAESKHEDVLALSKTVKNYFRNLEKKEKKYNSIKHNVRRIVDNFDELTNALKDSMERYSQAIQETLDKEIKENFQISSLSELISAGESKCSIRVIDRFDLTFEKHNIGFNILSDFINEVSSLSTVIFFESPAYWKVRDALLYAKQSSSSFHGLNNSIGEKLTGVPKYFYDLDLALKTEFKKNNAMHLEDICNSIREKLGGEFLFNGDNLIFKESGDKEYSKNTISFGMTNLGMIHALIKNNVVTTGSFLFIDEPETNLHPDWQVFLMKILVELAEKDVHVVIATHSLEMLKALEVSVAKKNRDASKFIGVNYFEKNGELLTFESDNPLEQLIECRSELNSSYSALYFDGITISGD